MSSEFLKLAGIGYKSFFPLLYIKLSRLGYNQDNQSNTLTQSKFHSLNYIKPRRDYRPLFYCKRDYKYH